MKNILFAMLTLSLVASAGVSAEEASSGQSQAKKVLITEAKLTDTEAGCVCEYTVKNMTSSPLKRFETYIFIKNEKSTFSCDLDHPGFKKPIEPNESRTLSNKAYGKACGAKPAAELNLVMNCNFIDGSECSNDDIEVTDTNLKWIEY